MAGEQVRGWMDLDQVVTLEMKKRELDSQVFCEEHL